MKAIRKEDGKEIEVRLYTEKRYVATEAEDGEIGNRIYREDALIIKEAVDWDAFRREAAKDILSGMMHHRVLSDASDRFYIPKEQVVFAAIGLANELVKQLKNGK